MGITKIFMPMDRESGRPRGFGFVEYDSRKDAEAAIAKMDQAPLGSRNLRVNESKPRVERSAGGGGFNASGSAEVKLYVGNLSYNTTEDSLRDIFAQSGEVTDCSLVTDRESGRPRGFGFITMPSADAQKNFERERSSAPWKQRRRTWRWTWRRTWRIQRRKRILRSWRWTWILSQSSAPWILFCTLILHMALIIRKCLCSLLVLSVRSIRSFPHLREGFCWGELHLFWFRKKNEKLYQEVAQHNTIVKSVCVSLD